MSSVGLSTVVGAVVGFFFGTIALSWLFSVTGQSLSWFFFNRGSEMLIALPLFVLLGAFIGFANEIGKR